MAKGAKVRCLTLGKGWQLFKFLGQRWVWGQLEHLRGFLDIPPLWQCLMKCWAGFLMAWAIQETTGRKLSPNRSSILLDQVSIHTLESSHLNSYKRECQILMA